MANKSPIKPASSLPLPTVQATGRNIPELACQHLEAASLFRDHVVRIEAEHLGQVFGPFFGEIRSYGTACIMSSAAALEALINELFISHTSKLRALLNDFEKQFWGKGGIESKRILDKYQLALSMLNMPGLDESSTPYLEVWSLIELRNFLVHYKPTWDPAGERQIRLEEVLDGRFHLSPFLDVGADFVSMKCMSSGCAKWAVNAVVMFVSEFDSRAHIEAHKIRAFLCGRGP